MLELTLRSGQVVAFDGRVLELFVGDQPSRRYHIDQLRAVEAEDAADGSSKLTLEDGHSLSFAPEEAPANARLRAAIRLSRAELADSRR
jgi:hypothetical protein